MGCANAIHKFKNPNEWQMYKSIPLKFDNQGYTKSFNIQTCNTQQVNQFYNNFGIVVFENILTEQQIQLTIDDLWKQTELVYSSKDIKIDRQDHKTWNFKGVHKTFGFVNKKPIEQLQIWKNRANPKVYHAFKQMYKIALGDRLSQPLIACLDRGELTRPAKINPEWKTQNSYHFDIDPWHWTGIKDQTTFQKYQKQYCKFQKYSHLLGQGNSKPYAGYTKLAGILALSDTNYITGGFEAALGFHNYIEKWCEFHHDQTRIQQDDKLMQLFQKVPLKKGSLLIYTQLLPHNIGPNLSQNVRYAQYLRMSPQSTLMLTKQMKQKRKLLIHPTIPKQLRVTQIVQQVFMLDDNK